MTSFNVQIKILRRKSTAAEYSVYKAGLEWDLTDPIVIESRDDLKSEVRWRDRFSPYHHQVKNLITFCRRLPVTLIADDVGLGKTISAGLIISELISRSRLSRILIVCPKLLGPQWQEELHEKFDLPSKIAIGRKLLTADLDETGAIITTYTSARLHLDSIPDDRFQMLVLDEAHKLRNLYGVDNPPLVARRFRHALENRRFRFVLMLTATPIHNRLWDLYSLVDLLTVARGHQNPFGSEGMFARKFIADNRERARQLKPAGRDEFRAIVYSYMSRIRRDDAKLYFPERIVQMHQVEPTSAELGLIHAIAKPIQNLNRLAQISILQALTSSPHALLVQLENMAANRTIDSGLLQVVRDIVENMPRNAKLTGLHLLIEQLQRKDPTHWRLVVFTGRLETQTTIQVFLEEHGLKVGIINGSSGKHNRETFIGFRRSPPDFHVIVSTEAGAEGINLQVANVLVNYDLPWNPMVVEQRIGRIQRLASEHATVAIFNIMLTGTFEEYIVGRLMEKLQLASHAIGDIESLLEASGLDGDSDEEGDSFEERIRKLVVASLEEKDVELATSQMEQSINRAKDTLEREQENIDNLLGGMDETEYVGPRAPKLPVVKRSMSSREFTLKALQNLGAILTQQEDNTFIVEQDGGRDRIRLDANGEYPSATLYFPGTPAFQRLVAQTIATGIYDIHDCNDDPFNESKEIARKWISGFGGIRITEKIEKIRRCFEGKALVRVRATVAHDSYERLVEVPCEPDVHFTQIVQNGTDPLPHTIEDTSILGINTGRLAEAAVNDEAISEFRRFYLERRSIEMESADGDERKKHKLEQEFTPRLEITLVALNGNLFRRFEVVVKYGFEASSEYESNLFITPHLKEITNAPEMAMCNWSRKLVPKTCLSSCQISGKLALTHFLVSSERSYRLALPEYSVVCSLSGNRLLQDEVEESYVTGKLVSSALLMTSSVSHKRAEPDYFGRCAFTDTEVLKSELVVSQVSGKHFRRDEQLRSVVSGKAGHASEFVSCFETGKPITLSEADQCEMTGNYVRPGILQTCAVTNKRVLPSEIFQCAATGKRALRKLFVTSNMSSMQILEEVALRSVSGVFCAPVEAEECHWSSQKSHPDDLFACTLTNLPVHLKFLSKKEDRRLTPLVQLLDGTKRASDEKQQWDVIASSIENVLQRGRCRVETAILSPNKKNLAVRAQIRMYLGLKVRTVGAVYSFNEKCILGRISMGRQNTEGRFVESS